MRVWYEERYAPIWYDIGALELALQNARGTQTCCQILSQGRHAAEEKHTTRTFLGGTMNQVMINAVELDMLMKENQDLKVRVKELNERLIKAQEKIRLLINDVGFAERGWTGTNDELLKL